MKKPFVLILVSYFFVMFTISPIHAQTSNDEYVDAYFAPELTPGSNFTWIVKEWDQMDDLLNPEANYVPKSGDLIRMHILNSLPKIPVSENSTWNILGWHIERFNFPTLDSKDDSQLLMEVTIANINFFHVFGNESDEGYNWKMLNFFLLLPYTVEYENGQTENFGKFCEATFGGIEVDVEVNVNSSTDLKVRGSINGEYEDTEITLDSHLGIREVFTYKKKSPTSQMFESVLNITLIESVFGPAPKHVIPGFSYLVRFSVICFGLVTILVKRRISIK